MARYRSRSYISKPVCGAFVISTLIPEGMGLFERIQMWKPHPLMLMYVSVSNLSRSFCAQATTAPVSGSRVARQQHSDLERP